MAKHLKKAFSLLSDAYLYSLTPVIAAVFISLSYSEFLSYICRAYWLVYMLHLAEKAFPKAHLNSNSKQVHLLDALVVPYHKKSCFTVQIILLTGLCIPVMMLMSTSSIIGKSSLYPSAAEAMFNTFVYSVLFLVPLILSKLSLDKLSSTLLLIIAVIFGIGYVFPQFFPLYSLLSVLLILLAPSLYFLEKTKWWNTDKASSSKLPIITKNQKGILTLANMSIVKQDEFLDAAGGGSFGWSFYYLYRIIRAGIKGTLQIEEALTWTTAVWILLFLSILFSIRAIRKIYVAKSMLRVVPIRKEDLFSACTSLALKPVLLIQTLLLATAFFLHAGTDFSAFFHSSHPIEIIVNGFILISLPIAVYLMSFTIYASKDRGLIGLILFIMIVIGAYSLLIGGAIVGNSLPSKIIFLLLISTVPYFTAYKGFKNLVNIHS